MKQLLLHAGSTRLSLALMGLLGGGLLLAQVQQAWLALGLAVALAALSLNLLAAILTDPRFRAQAPLLCFHLALLAVVVLVAAGRASALSGRIELTQGFAFEGSLLEHEAGALHPWHLRTLHFVQDGFEIDYAPGLRRGSTRNAVRWRDAGGREQHAVIGDRRPLVIEGYRFYTTPNKGYAPVFVWHPRDLGEPVRGAVHLPSYPLHELRQAREWALPGGRRVWVMLATEEQLIDDSRRSAFRMPHDRRVVLRTGAQRSVLAPGESLALDDGLLIYEDMRSWMGYKVFYDWSLPWLLAASLFGVLSLALHLVIKFRRRSWRVGSAVNARNVAPGRASLSEAAP